MNCNQSIYSHNIKNALHVSVRIFIWIVTANVSQIAKKVNTKVKQISVVRHVIHIVYEINLKYFFPRLIALVRVHQSVLNALKANFICRVQHRVCWIVLHHITGELIQWNAICNAKKIIGLIQLVEDAFESVLIPFGEIRNHNLAVKYVQLALMKIKLKGFANFVIQLAKVVFNQLIALNVHKGCSWMQRKFADSAIHNSIPILKLDSARSISHIKSSWKR